MFLSLPNTTACVLGSAPSLPCISHQMTRTAQNIYSPRHMRYPARRPEARAHNAEHRGGGLQRVEMQEELAISPEKLDRVQQIDDLLKKLEKENPRQAKVVELRYFGGLNFEEIGGLLQLTSRTVKTDWALARIWLLGQLQPGATSSKEAPG
jgi:DNA-directed RNA polymerase specialized sigma24 family protein